jgi:formylglycine-generating enzyme required for sulfatase activity/tRNA A-37 threonylcarbamoyl transferase component Bud32
MSMDKSYGDEQTIGPGGKSGGGHAYALKVGDLFGQYRVIRVLGAGGMGEVYEVEHKVLRRRYAIKLLPEALDWKGVSIERFEREAQVMANLDHPNILKVDEFGEVDGRYWLRMELAEGIECSVFGFQYSGGEKAVSLQDLAEAGGGKVPQEVLLPVLRQILEGLQYAHSHGAIHRDLKPSNILLSSTNPSSPNTENRPPNTIQAKIADFGLVRLVGEDWVRSQAQLSVQRSMSMGDQKTVGVKAESEGTSTRALLGTYEYMSPEQKRGEEADERSDLYAVGLLAYRLLTGRQLPTRMPSRLGFSAAWDDLIEDAVEEEVNERTGSCSAMLRQLGALLPGNAEPQLGPKPATRPVEVKDAQPPPIHGPDDDTAPGTERSIDLGDGIEMKFCWVPATTSAAHRRSSGGKDTFTMGSPDDEPERFKWEGPQHEVKLTEGFWMGKYPVTQGQYEKVMGENPSSFKREIVEKEGFLGVFGRQTRDETQPDHPVECVSWDDAVKFCKILQRLADAGDSSQVFRLPTEAEWEYAARGGPLGRGKLYAGSDNIDEVAWYRENSEGRTQRVGNKAANELGLHDMSGNVWEWVHDWHEDYSGLAPVDPSGPQSSSSRVNRGGSWAYTATFCRVAFRDGDAPSLTINNLGFRVVLAAPVPAAAP